MNKIDEMSRVIGNIESKVNSILERLDNLPCAGESTKIDTLEDRVAKVEGKITMISALSGFVGSILFAVVSWFLSKIKW